MADRKMHADELDIDTDLVRRLLREQFPHWAELEIERVPDAGTDNALYRLGADMVVRLPRREHNVIGLEKERMWLPRLAVATARGSCPARGRRTRGGISARLGDLRVARRRDRNRRLTRRPRSGSGRPRRPHRRFAPHRHDRRSTARQAQRLPRRTARAPRPTDAVRPHRAEPRDRHSGRDLGVGGGARRTGVERPARLDPRGSRRAKLARSGGPESSTSGRSESVTPLPT